MEDIYSSLPYKRSRAAYHIQCITEYLVTLLMADAFLAKLLKNMGLPDTQIGIVSSLMSLAFLIQIATIFLMQHIGNVKRCVILIDVSSMLCFFFTYLLPFLTVSQSVRTLLVFLTVGGGFLLKYLQLNMYYKWGHSFVDPKRRGSFTARNEAISLAVGVIFSLVMGKLVDSFESKGDIKGSFLIISAIIAVLTVLDLLMLLMIHPYSRTDAIKQQKSFREVLKNTLGNRSFRNVVIMISLFDIARYMSIGFLGTFKTQELLLSVGTVQIINISANALRCIISRPVGKWADRTSFAHVYRKGLILCMTGFLMLVFTTPKTWWLIIGYTVLYNVSMAGIAGNANNMSFSYVPIDYFVQAQAIRSSIAGTAGFLASILASRILGTVQANGNMVFGMHLYGQQVLAALSVIILAAAIIFNKCVVEKQKVIKQ